MYRFSALLMFALVMLMLVAPQAQPLAQDGAADASGEQADSPDAQVQASGFLRADELAAITALAHDPIKAGPEAVLRQMAALSAEPAADSHDARELQRMKLAAWGEMLWRNMVAQELQPALADLLAKHPEQHDALRKSAEGQWLLALHAREQGRVDDARALGEELGFINNWLLAGPFDNERNAGVNADLEPIQSIPAFDQVFTGKGGREIAWRRLKSEPMLGALKLNELMTPNDQTMAYLATLLNNTSDSPITIDVRTASDEGYRVWLNGVECFADPAPAVLSPKSDLLATRLRNVGFDSDNLLLTLRPGTNSLVFKVMEDSGNWGLRARIDRSSPSAQWVKPGVSISQLNWEDALADAEQNWSADAEAELQTRPLVPAPKSLRDRFFVALYYLYRSPFHRKERMPAKLLQALLEDLEAADASAEQLAPVLFALSDAERSTASIASGSDENRRRELLQQVAELDPKHVPALSELAKYYTTNLQLPERATDYAERALALCPTELGATMARVGLYRQQGNDALAERALRKFVATRGSAIAYRYLGFLASRRDNWDQALIDWDAAIQHEPSDVYSTDRVLSLLTESGRIDAASEYYEAWQSLNPLSNDLTASWAKLLAGHERYAEALSVIERSLELNPDDADALVQGAEYSDLMAARLERERVIDGREAIDGVGVEGYISRFHEQAMAMRKRALVINPRQPYLKRYVEFREGGVAEWEERLQEDISERIELALESEPDAINPLDVIYQDTITQVFKDGTSQSYFQVALRINNEEGLRLLPYYRAAIWGDGRVLSASAHRSDGTTLPMRISDVWVDTTGIAVGDVLNVRSRALDTDKGFFGDVYYTVEGMAASFHPYLRAASEVGAPVREIRQVYVLPLEREFQIELLRGEGVVRSDEQIEDHRVVSFRARDLQRIENEPLGPDISHVRPCIFVSTFKDWQAFGAWYRDLITPQLIATPAMIEQVETLTHGMESEEQKVRAIYHWVVQNIRYNADWHFGEYGYKPFEAGVIFERCIGDCKDKAILICTMLAAADITAYPVIISLEGIRKREEMPLAMPGYFNHAIACVEYADGTRKFLDGTATFNAYDEFPSGDAGATVVLVKPDGGELVKVPVPPASNNCDAWQVSITIDANAKSSASFTNTPKGEAAATWRSALESDASAAETLNDFLTHTLAGASVAESDQGEAQITRGEPHDLTKPLRFSFDADLGEYAKLKGDTLTLRPVLAPNEWAATALGVLPSRTQPLFLPAPWGESESSTIELPEGFELQGELPAAIELNHPAFSYHLRFTLNGRTLSVDRAWSFTATEVSAADYTAFRAALVASDAADRTGLTLTKKAR